MRKMKSILMPVLWLSSGNILALAGQQRVDVKETVSLDADKEKHALQVLAKLTEKVIVSAADAMPADKYGFAPTDGEFKGAAQIATGECSSHSPDMRGLPRRTSHDPSCGFHLRL